MESTEDIRFGADLLADGLLAMAENPNGARLQALVIASALAGVYSPPFRSEIFADDLAAGQEFVLGSGVFPLTTRADCLDALVMAITSHQLSSGLILGSDFNSQQTQP